MTVLAISTSSLASERLWGSVAVVMPAASPRRPAPGNRCAVRTGCEAVRTPDAPPAYRAAPGSGIEAPAMSAAPSKTMADKAAEYGLKADEYQVIVRRLNREPNDVELGVFSVMW